MNLPSWCDAMNAVRQILRKVLVVGMIPFILGAGLPQMECRCAAAKGQRWCECCFRKPDDARPADSSRKPCCQRQQASRNPASSLSQVAEHARPGCPTCHQFKNPKTGSCCSLKQADAPTLSKLTDAPDLNVAPMWLPLPANASFVATAKMATRHERLSRACQMPSLDRVIVFEHLLI